MRMIEYYSYRKQFEKWRATAPSLLSLGDDNSAYSSNDASHNNRRVVSLNGDWHFTIDPYETCLRNDWFKEEHFDKEGKELPIDYNFDDNEEVTVPSCWNMVKPEYFYYENLGIYTRNFKYEQGEKDERVFLQFEGASYRAYVFLNGESIALHDGASTPFSVEVTGKLKGNNRLIVAVDASRSPDRVPAEYTDWFNYGGLYRSVSLVITPKTFIQNTFVYLMPNGRFDCIAADVTINGSDYAQATLTIKELNIAQTIPITTNDFTKSYSSISTDYNPDVAADILYGSNFNPPANTHLRHTSHVETGASPILWSPEHPKLYDVTITCGKDSITERIGFRELKVEGRNILLNGKNIFLKGMSVHEDHNTLGKCNTEENIRAIMKDIKSLNGNFLRLAHYPHSRLVAKIADEEGILLWEEIPVYWSIDFANKETYADAENQLTELIMRDRNRASVIIWSVGNENLDTDERFSFMSRLAAKAHELDSTRAVSAACLVNGEKKILDDRLASCLDVIGMNEYYGWYSPHFEDLLTILSNSNPDKPVIISEFGAGARAGHHGGATEMWTEEFQAEIYKHQTETIGKCPYIKGMTPWILYDFRAARRQNKYQQCFNRKGLIDSNHKTKKQAFKILADFYKNK